MMEDSQNKQGNNFDKELKNISNLEQRINQAKKELNQLFKIENHQNKYIQTIYKQSLLTTRNKLNFFQNHQLLSQHHHHLNQDLKEKRDKVKEIKAREEKQLKEAKESLKVSKEKERLIIRNSSLRYDETIKKNKQSEQEAKQKLVREMKQQKENFKQSLKESRLKEQKQKQVALFSQTLAKIERQPSLMKELDILTKEKQLIESKVRQRKLLKYKLQQEVQKIKKLQTSEISELISGEDQETKRRNGYQLNAIKPELLQQKKLLKSVQSLDNLLRPLIPEGRYDLKLQ